MNGKLFNNGLLIPAGRCHVSDDFLNGSMDVEIDGLLIALCSMVHVVHTHAWSMTRGRLTTNSQVHLFLSRKLHKNCISP